MQVTNNTYTNYYNQTNNTTKVEKTEESSFASMLTGSQKEEEVGRYVKYMDQFNYFDSLSDEDRKVFREILKDDKITMAEMDSLSYEQAVRFEKVAFPQGNFSKEQLNNTPIVNIPNQGVHMLFATRTTNDKTFNEALYRTAREIDDDSYRRTIFREVKTNVTQVHFGDPLIESFNVIAYENAKNLWKEDIDKMNINFDKFLTDVITLHEKALANPKTHPAVIDQHQEKLDGYNIILKHYNDIKKESIYA